MRILHLTDLHLRHHLPGTSAVPGRESRLMPEVLAAAVQAGAERRPDLGVLSGDLVDVPEGERDSRDCSRAWDDLQIVVGILRRTDVPWVVVSGNHDLAEQVKRAFPVDMDWSVCGYRVVSFEDREQRGHVPERLGRERDRFRQAVGDESSLPQIHVQHYVIQPRLDAGYPHTYRDGEELADEIVSSLRVRLVLSGHYHPGVSPFRQGKTWFSVAPALCARPFPAMIYDLDDATLTWERMDIEGLL